MLNLDGLSCSACTRKFGGSRHEMKKGYLLTLSDQDTKSLKKFVCTKCAEVAPDESGSGFRIVNFTGISEIVTYWRHGYREDGSGVGLWYDTAPILPRKSKKVLKEEEKQRRRDVQHASYLAREKVNKHQARNRAALKGKESSKKPIVVIKKDRSHVAQ